MFLTRLDEEIYKLLARSHEPCSVLGLLDAYMRTSGPESIIRGNQIDSVARALTHLAFLGLSENTSDGWVAVTDPDKVREAILKLENEALELLGKYQKA